jgi:hypothetical protein
MAEKTKTKVTFTKEEVQVLSTGLDVAVKSEQDSISLAVKMAPLRDKLVASVTGEDEDVTILREEAEILINCLDVLVKRTQDSIAAAIKFSPIRDKLAKDFDPSAAKADA